jgi:hypothetical protein
MPSSAEVPYFAWRSRPPSAKLCTTVKLPSLTKLPSLARSPIVAKLSCKLAFLGGVATGVIASIPLALMQVLRCPHHGRCFGAVAIVAVTAEASLWSSRWRRCQCRLGIVAIATVVTLRTLPWRRCHCCHCGAGIIAALASLRTSPWRRLGIVAVAALASLQTLPWRRCHCCHPGAGIIADITLAPLGYRCRHSAGIIADVALVPLPLSPLRRWRHRGAGIIADVALAPLEHHRRRGAGVIADVALPPLPLSLLRRWRHRGALASSGPLPWRRLGIVAFAALASSQTLPCTVFIIAFAALASCGAGVIVAVALALLHGGQDDSILSAILAKLHSKSGHLRNSCQILQNCATELRRACAELVPKLLLQIPLYVDFLILIPLCHMSMSIIASSAYLLGP